MLNVYTEADQHTILDTYLDHVNDGSRYLLRQAVLLNLPVKTLVALGNLVTDGTFSPLDSRFVSWLAERPQQSEQIINRYATITDAFLDVLDEGLKIGLPFDTIDVFAEIYEGNLTEHRKGIMKKVAENPELQQTNFLTDILDHDELLIRAMLEERSRYFDGDGLTLESKQLLIEVENVFGFQPMRESIRLDIWSFNDAQAYLDIYQNLDPFGTITQGDFDKSLDKYNVTDEKLRGLLQHVANVTYVENAKDENGNRLTPASFKMYNAEELMGLVSYDSPNGPYFHVSRIRDRDGEVIELRPQAESKRSWMLQATDESGNTVSPFLLMQEEIRPNDYRYVSDDPAFSDVMKTADWMGKNMRHFGTGDEDFYTTYGYPEEKWSAIPPELLLAVTTSDELHVGGSHSSSALMVSILRNLNISAMEVHVRGHGSVKIFLGEGKVAYWLGNNAFDGCLNPPMSPDISIDKQFLSEAQFSEYEKDPIWFINYITEINPECAKFFYG